MMTSLPYSTDRMSALAERTFRLNTTPYHPLLSVGYANLERYRCWLRMQRQHEIRNVEAEASSAASLKLISWRLLAPN